MSTGNIKQNKLISIIVPVYNVSEYLSNCIDSIIKQTYQNLQIILVDDGSTDESSKICDDYNKIDSRIIVIHKENGGLSSARNVGLSYATGDYIGFVDSDDMIDIRMYETLYNLCEENKVLLACARFDYINPENKTPLPNDTDEIEKISSMDMIKLLLNTSKAEKRFATISVWDRLYHKSIIENLRFPEGKCYEDIVYSIKAIINAKECVYINKSLYHYRVREGSITYKDSQYNEKWLTDKLPLENERVEYLKKAGYSELATLFQVSSYLDLYKLLKLCDTRDRNKIKKIIKSNRVNIIDIIKSKKSFSFIIKNIIKVVFAKIYVAVYY